MANIARLGVTLGLETSTFQQGIARAKKGLQELASQITTMATVGAAAFTAMAYKSIAFADEISDLADATDVSIASILQFGDALRLSGGKADDAGKVLAKFTENIDAAAQGSKELQVAFGRVGVSLQDLLNELDITRKVVVSVNDTHESDMSRQLQDGDQVKIFSSISGG